MKQPAPLDLDALLVAVNEFYEARGASRDRDALGAAERICFARRASLLPDAVITSRVDVFRSLWRRAQRSDLDQYMDTALARELARNIAARSDFAAGIVRENLNEAGQPVTVPKHMHRHSAAIRIVMLLLKQEKPRG